MGNTGHRTCGCCSLRGWCFADMQIAKKETQQDDSGSHWSYRICGRCSGSIYACPNSGSYIEQVGEKMVIPVLYSIMTNRFFSCSHFVIVPVTSSPDHDDFAEANFALCVSFVSGQIPILYVKKSEEQDSPDFLCKTLFQMKTIILLSVDEVAVLIFWRNYRNKEV